MGGRGTRPAGRRARPRSATRRARAWTVAPSAPATISTAAQPVEVFIAFSILVGAVRAIRPIFPGKEATVAAFFGLGHGLAFSLALAGFNLGIECMQLSWSRSPCRA
ncbi:HupE/UreJ family protein [Streptomyces fuscichromogenes]|uniref:HupE/UreJ family protein n=1 Tax=Streptomyces fuscichromogenes TaxID=1324013 RepID=UPI0037FBC87F